MTDRWRPHTKTDDSSRSVKRITETHFETLKIYYDKLSQQLLEDESTVALSAEFRNLFQKFEVNFRHQERVTLKLKEFVCELRSKDDELSTCREEIREKEIAAQARVREVQKLKRIAQDAVYEKNELNKEVVTLREIINTTSGHELQKTILKLRNEAESHQTKYDKLMENFHKEVATKDADKLLMEETLKKEQWTSQKLGEQLAALKTDLWKENLKYKRANREIMDLRRNVSDVKDEKKHLMEEIKCNKSEIEKIRKESKDHQEEAQKFEVKCEDLLMRVNVLEKKCEDSKRRTDRMSSENRKLLQDMQKANDNVETLSYRYTNLLKEKANVSARVAKLDDILHQAEDTLKLKCIELQALEKTIEGLKSQLAARNNDYTALQKIKAMSDEKLANSVQHLEYLDDSLKNSNNRLRASHVKNQRLTNDMAFCQRELGKTRFEKTMLMSKLKSKIDEFDMEKSRNFMLEKKLAPLKRSEDDLKTKVKQYERQIRQLFQEIGRVKNEWSFSEKQCEKERMKTAEIAMYLARIKDKYTQESKESAHVRTNNKKLLFSNHAFQESHRRLINKLSEANVEIMKREDMVVILTKRMFSASQTVKQYQLDVEAQGNTTVKLDSLLSWKQEECRLLWQKMELYEVILKRGETDYSKRILDVRLLKTEVLERNRSIACLREKMLQFMKLKEEVIVLGKELTAEKLRAKALEHNLLHRTNLHQWRQIGTDNPNNLKHVVRNRMLQKRVVQQTRLLKEAAVSIEEKDSIISALKERCKQPDLGIKNLKWRHKKAITNLQDRVHCLKAELNMCHSTIQKHESEIHGLKQKLFKCMNRKAPKASK